MSVPPYGEQPEDDPEATQVIGPGQPPKSGPKHRPDQPEPDKLTEIYDAVGPNGHATQILGQPISVEPRYEPFSGEPQDELVYAGEPYGENLPTSGTPAPPVSGPPPGPPFGAPPPSQPSKVERDRVWPHFIWEFLLLAAVVGVVLLIAATQDDAFAERARNSLLTNLAVVGFLASGLALSLRSAAPNLAVGAVAVLSGVLTAWLTSELDWPLAGAIAATVAAALIAGLVLGLFVAVLHVPAWAATIGAAFLLVMGSLALGGTSGIRLSRSLDVDSLGWLWAALFAVVSVAGGVLWLIPGVRRALSGTRQDRDPGRRPGFAGAIGVVIALGVSCALAGGSGVLNVARLGGSFGPSTGLDLTLAAALGAVLIGGVSIFGRRGGVLGTVLGVALLSLVLHWMQFQDFERWAQFGVVGAAVMLGLVVSRLLETAGRKYVVES